MATNDVETIKRHIPPKLNLKTVRFVSFNINGINTLFNYYPYAQLKTMQELFQFLKADFITLQELKTSKDSVGSFMGRVDKYYSFITVPQVKKGYSGVGVYVRQPTLNVDSEDDFNSDDVEAMNDFLKVRKVEEGITGLLKCHEYIGSEKSYKDIFDLADRYKSTSIDIDKKYNETREKFLIGGYDLSSVKLTREELLELDSQGRCIVVEMGCNVVVISCYCPANSTRTEDGELFRTRFLRVLKQRTENLKEMGKEVILLGDINVARDLIDSADNMQRLLGDTTINKYKNGEELEYSNVKLVEEFSKSTAPRAYINSMVYNSHLKDSVIFIDKKTNVLGCNDKGEPLKAKTESLFVDSDDECEDAGNVLSMKAVAETLYNTPFLYDLIREYCGKELKLYTCWNTLQNLRPVNFGSRIDLILATSNIKNNLKNAGIWRFLNGSDHCPIFCDIELGDNLNIVKDYRKFFIPRLEAKNLYGLNDKTIMSMFKNLNNNASFLKKNKEASSLLNNKKRKIDEGVGISLATRNKADNKVETKQIIYVSRKGDSNNNKKQRTISTFFKKVEPKIKESANSNKPVLTNPENVSVDVDKLFEKTKTKFLKQENKDVVQLPVQYKIQPRKKKSIMEMVSSKPSKYQDAPKCNHGITCVLKTSMTQKTKGKKFWCCSKNSFTTNGNNSANPEMNCGYFKWA